MFATGIENSSPKVILSDGLPHRVDEMEKCGHYDHWRDDFNLVRELGLRFLRYGPPYYRTHIAPDKYDWSFSDETFAELRRLKITPITDLCHFGVPDWIGNFQNPDLPRLFADYAFEFARRYPWVRFFTPVNEIHVAARFSALYGWWNECLKSQRAFVRALVNLVKANLLAEEAILRAHPTAIFIQSESTEYFHASNPIAYEQAQTLNEQRFLSLDFCYGHDLNASTYLFLADNGLKREEYEWFINHGSWIKPHCIMGNDYYVTNEHDVQASGALEPAGEVFGYYVITAQYFDRYHLPVMHTETNLPDPKAAPNWLSKQWSNMLRLKQDGVPIVGFTWYSLTDQMDWDTTLRENNNRVNPLGLYDLQRRIRPVGEAYRTLVAHWRDILPADSKSLDLNIPDGDIGD